MKRRIMSLLLVAACLAAVAIMPVSGAQRDITAEESLAADLKELGLFFGVTDSDFALGRAPLRSEALVMLVRLLGKSSEALAGGAEHPFTDVPAWADAYVGYAYANGLTNGISDTLFGEGPASAAMYLTFVLRALGYSDRDGEDFTWDEPYVLARRVGILPAGVDTKNFLRADVVVISYAALSAHMKGGGQTLAEKLIGEGAFTARQYDKAYDPAALALWRTPSAITEGGYQEDGGDRLGYLLYTPADAVAGMPLVVYLHGGSGKGEELSLLTGMEGFPQYLAEGLLGEVPAYVLIPQLSADKRGWADMGETLLSLIDVVVQNCGIDEAKISLTGHSMGGTGAWAIAGMAPEKFSCVAPMSGSIQTTKANLEALTQLPVWAFVGAKDAIVAPDTSVRFVEALKRAGGNARVTVLEQADHFAVPEAYLNETYSLLDWMLEQTADQ